MATRKYVATIKLSNGGTQKITIQADNEANAKAMLEAQYGRGAVLSIWMG